MTSPHSPDSASDSPPYAAHPQTPYPGSAGPPGDPAGYPYAGAPYPSPPPGYGPGGYPAPGGYAPPAHGFPPGYQPPPGYGYAAGPGYPSGPGYAPGTYAGGPGHPGGYGFAPVPQYQNGMGIAALICGCAGFLFSFTVIPSLLAIIFGFIGLSRAKKGVANNKGVALAGLILGVIGVAIAIVWAVSVYLFLDNYFFWVDWGDVLA